MAKYQVVIEAPGHIESHTFEAESQKEADAIGQVYFDNVCNYGVSLIEDTNGMDDGAE